MSISLTTREFILSSLEKVGVDNRKLAAIAEGAEIYGPEGLLDSIHLVGFIAEMGEWMETRTDSSGSFFDILDGDLFENFKNINEIEALLSRRYSHVSFSS
ncbi:hypothetical protein J1781_10885 [Rahnella sp. C60]|uniref:Carrier domain-containing protein n=1 Tax=Rahnella perminowiae TaxID=2816244 RepID=A0ABS6L3S3_9GAMM|nr:MULTISPECIES: hypothetical protein [Rahnella]UJD92038.1 hypothetical protein FS594_25125 [Rahnella aquatilis]MBU9815357.1 hypothetical protein [Rahnella perminowiae]MBU9825179.1 hypothetical protein [Rahnella perminowiae]MBU9836335.1 hypothetical protein [Rahnella perminowiae]MCR9003570.1 hypothetical protein [Rahnella perminowiae]